MKKAIMLAVVLLTAALLHSQTWGSGAGTQDTSLGPHDLIIVYDGNGGVTPINTNQGCRGCHVPHNGVQVGESAATSPNQQTVFGTAANGSETLADIQIGKMKLWDKLLPTSTFTTYSSDNVTAGSLGPPTNSSDPQMHSYLCLSCHDGTAAGLNLPSGMVGDDHILTGTRSDVGSLPDLTADHPVNIVYPTANGGVVGTTKYEVAALVTSGGTAYNTNEPLPLFGGTVQCATCHNPHKQPNNNQPLNGNGGNFMRVAEQLNGNTSLCRTCHIDKR
jgi:hypothetical protein